MPIRNQDMLDIITHELLKNGGDVFKACSVAKVSVSWLRRWCDEDHKARQEIEGAKRDGITVLESAMLTRALDGLEEDVYYKGEIVGRKKTPSDALLMFALKGRNPEVYNPAQQIESNITMRFQSMSDDQLLEEIERIKKRLEGSPANVVTIDADIPEADTAYSEKELLALPAPVSDFDPNFHDEIESDISELFK
jgi:hypothetical protein